MSIAYGLLSVLVVLTAAPFMLSIIARTKAIFAGRRGPPWLQPYFDLVKLLQKAMVQSRSTTSVFRLGPTVGLAAIVVAAGLLPVCAPSPLGFAGDLILFVYLLGLSRFLTVVSALDTASSFEGMGAAREVGFAVLVEPALFMILLALARLAHSSSLSAMFDGHTPLGASAGVLLGLSLFLVILCETNRVPFDDPNTHLELTMVHEVMVLDHSGPALSFVLYGHAIKLFSLGWIWSRLVLGAINVPRSIWWQGGATAVTMVVAMVGIGVLESLSARARLTRIPALLTLSLMLAGAGLWMAGHR